MCDRCQDVLVIVVGTDGAASRQCWIPAAGCTLLGQLQGAVGGLVDVVELIPFGQPVPASPGWPAMPENPGLDMWLRDDGIYTQPPNPVAPLIAGRRGRLTQQPYFGPVVFTDGADEHGTAQGLIYTFIDQLEREIRTAPGGVPPPAKVRAPGKPGTRRVPRQSVPCNPLWP